jgi:hypothetical protein
VGITFSGRLAAFAAAALAAAALAAAALAAGVPRRSAERAMAGPQAASRDARDHLHYSR